MAFFYMGFHQMLEIWIVPLFLGYTQRPKFPSHMGKYCQTPIHSK